MPHSGTKLVFFGNERLVSALPATNAPILRMLIQQDYCVTAVVSHHTEERSRKKRPLEVAEIAHKHNIPVFTPNRPADILEELKALGAEAAILVAYGRIIPQAVIDVFPKGIINIHPSLLPKYRGPTPIESAILNRDTQTGVSIMALSAGMDEGPIYAQSSLSLNGTENKFDVYNLLAPLGAKLLQDTLPHILSGFLQPTPQNGSLATYSKLLKKEDGILNPGAHTAEQLEAQVRAYLGFPKSRVTINGYSIIITAAEVVSEYKTPLDLECAGGAYLRISELVAPNGKRMSGEAFLRGYAA